MNVTVRIALQIFSIGSARVVVTQPRLPCYKLGGRFESHDMVRRFLESGRTGFYLAVTCEGEVGATDEIKQIARDLNAVPISEITRLYVAKRYSNIDVELMQRALRVAALPERWKEYFCRKISSGSAGATLLEATADSRWIARGARVRIAVCAISGARADSDWIPQYIRAAVPL